MKTLALLTAILTFIACNKTIEVIHPSPDALIFGDPFSYGVDNMMLFPVGTNYTPEVIRRAKGGDYVPSGNVVTFQYNDISSGTAYDRKASREYVNQDEKQSDIRNILFYNQKTGKTYPLFVDTLHILSFAIHNNYDKPLIFYRVVKHDMNKDSVYTQDDPVMLYISDIYGTSFTQITPSNEQFIDYTEYLEDGKILVKTRINSDNDLEFTTYDETNFREVQLADPQMGREIFTPGLKDSLRSMIH